MVMPEPSVLLCMVIFGAFGMGYFLWGKNQARFVAIIAGILLCVYPYFITDLLWMIVIGVVLLAAPWVIEN